jgi:hypothetical protein
MTKSKMSIEFYLIGTGGGSGYTNVITCEFRSIEAASEMYNSTKNIYKKYKLEK